MFDNRFSDLETALPERRSPQFSNAFHLIPVAADSPQPSSLQWLYQQMYAQALQTSQESKSRDLFAVMN